MKRTILAMAAASLWVTGVQAATYTIDGAHSSVSFRIKHVIGKVTGHFDKFEGTFDYDAARPQAWKTQATIDAASINTGIEKRDTHLRSPDFFDTQKFPSLSFKSTGVTDVKGTTAKLHGDLTLHGVTKPVVLDLDVSGVVQNPRGGGNLAGATATGRINRLDYGVGSSGPMVGDDVEIVIDIEGIGQ